MAQELQAVLSEGFMYVIRIKGYVFRDVVFCGDDQAGNHVFMQPKTGMKVVLPDFLILGIDFL